jgi:DNA-binding Xre family transcriptional regulator
MKGWIKMRIDRVKLIAEMARRDMRVQELADKATVSRATVTALRGGKSCNENSVLRVAQALGVPMETLLENAGKGEFCD